MRPHATTSDLPSTHDVTVFIHNEFLTLLDTFKKQLRVSLLVCCLITLAVEADFDEAAPGRVSTTIDGWSVPTTKRSFLGITGHWIDVTEQQWALKSEVLAFRAVSGQHSGENLGRYFFRLCERAGIFTSTSNKVRCIVPYIFYWF
jgi:hypothetical protein